MFSISAWFWKEPYLYFLDYALGIDEESSRKMY